MMKADATLSPGNRKYVDPDISDLGMPIQGSSLPKARTGEAVSALCSGNARGLAKLAAFMANKGSLNGEQLISEDAWEAAHEEPT